MSSDFEQLAALATYNPARDEDHLERLWLSTRRLHENFGVTPEVERQIPLVVEETNEAITAARDESADELAGEIVDCFVVLIGLAMARGISLDKLHSGMNAVIAKNDAKTEATHYLNPSTLKITRR